MTHNKSYSDPFTAYSNRYIDTIKPQLTDTQRDICDIIFRLTAGWHKSSARISNATFVVKSGKSERAIITAKKQLIDMGLLVMLEPAKACKAALYILNLDYKDSIGSSQPEIPDVIDDAPQLIDETELFIHEDAPLPLQPETSETVIDSEPTTIPDEAITNDNSGSTEDVNPCSTTDDEVNVTELSSALYSNNNKSTSLKIKHTLDTTQPIGIKKSINTVCYKFFNLFPEVTDDSDTRKFIGWATKTYGMDLCLSKLDYMREYGKLNKIGNPQGLFRVALVKDYQSSKWINDVIKSRKKAELAYEHGQSIITEMEQWKEQAVDWEAGQAALNNMIAMLGQTE